PHAGGNHPAVAARQDLCSKASGARAPALLFVRQADRAAWTCTWAGHGKGEAARVKWIIRKNLSNLFEGRDFARPVVNGIVCRAPHALRSVRPSSDQGPGSAHGGRARPRQGASTLNVRP